MNHSIADIISRSYTHKFADTDLYKIISYLQTSGFPTDTYIAGGCIRATLEGKKDLSNTDIDLFFKTEQAEKRTKEWLEMFGKLQSETQDVSNYVVEVPFYITEPSLSLESLNTVVTSKKQFMFQMIKHRYYNTAEDLIDSFDFTICQFAIEPVDPITDAFRNNPNITWNILFTSGEFALWDLGRRRLAVNKITYPVSSMRRLIKYAQHGYKACNGCMQAILQSVVDNPSLLNTRFQYID